MSTRTIAIIFVVLLIILGIMLFGNSAGAPAQMGTGAPTNAVAPVSDTAPTPPTGMHTMPDGSVMMNTDANANMHMMPDGTMMSN